VEHAQVRVMHKEVDIDVKQEVNFLDNVEHTQVGVMQANDEVDYLEKDKHTQDVLHKNDVDIPTHVGVDENFIVRDGEQEVLSVNERSTHQTAIKKLNNKINKEVIENFQDDKEKIDKEIEKKINKEEILFKIACNKIIKSLKKLKVNGSNFKMGFKDQVVRPMVDIDGGVKVVLDDGRFRPRDYFCDVVNDFGFIVVLLDDGRMRPRRCYDVSDYFYDGDGQNRVFNDGG